MTAAVQKGVSVFAIPCPLPPDFTPRPGHVPENLCFIALGEHVSSTTYEVKVEVIQGILGSSIQLNKPVNTGKK